ncbi:lipoprotein-releasing system permease protein [Pedobacter cryoconitis]|uniref:Lipoprotein-releasing system permease protein n=1 Tax=Pedobacter cryoconitis TaxID=188932 RepID=A0A7W8ZSR1_9SPHI|nr:FtsX-like permease family protein [Pedobacter cryoconitis]MBB5639182.1 lipoprotein-releasing system permease protein [Pedobacter cryoconitis]
MNTEYFIARRIAIKSERTFSKLIVRIAIAGVMLSLAVMMLSIAIIKGFKTEIQEKVRGFVGDVRIFKLDLNNSFELTPFVASPKTLSDLKNNKDIAYFQPYATKPAIISANDEVEGINFKGIDGNYNWDYISKHLVSGRIINFADSAKATKEILISSFTANRLKLKTGDNFIMYFVQNPPRKRPFKIVGIYDIGVEEIDKSFVLGDINIIRRLNNWQPNEIGGIEIKLKNFGRLQTASDKIYASMEINLKSESVKEYFPNIFTWLSLLDVNTRVLLILMMIVGVINMITALLIMILERTNMIGMLKAFGMTDFSIMKIFLYNALYLVGIGLILGNILGLGLGFLQQYTHIFKLNQSSYYLAYVPVELHLTDVLLLNIATILICFTVLILPSLLVSRVSPLKAIRFK